MNYYKLNKISGLSNEGLGKVRYFFGKFLE